MDYQRLPYCGPDGCLGCTVVVGTQAVLAIRLAHMQVQHGRARFQASPSRCRQRVGGERAAHYENLSLPPDVEYMQVAELGVEVRQTLNKQRPETLGLASRMSGVTPAAISLLMVHLKKQGFKITRVQ